MQRMPGLRCLHLSINTCRAADKKKIPSTYSERDL
jgi:hypothetical protein